MNIQSKLDSILSQLVDDSFLTEDRYSRYRLAVEVLGESEK